MLVHVGRTRARGEGLAKAEEEGPWGRGPKGEGEGCAPADPVDGPSAELAAGAAPCVAAAEAPVTPSR